MSHELNRFYRHLSVSETLSLPLQHAMLRYARQRGDNDLLVRLVNRSDLATEVDVLLGQISAAPVRAAWVARPNRSVEAARAVLAGEKRIGVLTALAETVGLGAVAYEALAERDHPKIAAALSANPDTSESVRAQCLTTLARSSMRTRDTVAAFERALQHHRELVDEAALAVERSDAADVLVRWVHRGLRGEEPVELSQEAIHHLVTEVVEAEMGAVAAITDQWERQRTAHGLAQIASMIATLPQLEEATLEALERISAQLQALPQANHWAGYRGPDTELRLALEQARTRHDAGAPDPTTCPAELVVELAGHAIARRDSTLAVQLARNPATSVAVLEQLRNLLSYSNELLEILRARQGDREATTMLLGLVSWNLSFDDAVEAAGGAEAFAAYLEAQLRETRMHLPSHVWNAEVLTDEVVTGLPLSLLLAECPANRFARLVQETLTFTDEESWAVVEALMENFTGSLRDLRATVEDLGAE